MNRLREAREYVKLSMEEAAIILNQDIYFISGVECENGRYSLSDWQWERLSKLYRRSVAWLKGEPSPQVEISPELDRLMERLSDPDRDEIMRFAEFLREPHR